MVSGCCLVSGRVGTQSVFFLNISGMDEVGVPPNVPTPLDVLWFLVRLRKACGFGQRDGSQPASSMPDSLCVTSAGQHYTHP